MDKTRVAPTRCDDGIMPHEKIAHRWLRRALLPAAAKNDRRDVLVVRCSPDLYSTFGLLDVCVLHTAWCLAHPRAMHDGAG